MERQQGFLQKISDRVDEEKRNQEAKKLQKEKLAMAGKKKGKSGKPKKAAVPQVLWVYNVSVVWDFVSLIVICQTTQ